MTKQAPRAFTGYMVQQKLPLKVGVNITGELLKAKGEYHLQGDVWITPIGGSMATNAPVLARQVFADVVEMSNGRLPANQSVAAILTPRVAYITRTVAATRGGESIMDIKVEWTLADSKGNTIWVNTIDGRSIGTRGSLTEDLAWEALENVLLKSQTAISSAQAIRHFVQRQSP